MVLLGVLSQYAMGQAEPTATRAVSFSVYGAASEIEPDYGPQRNYGFFFGTNSTRRARLTNVVIESRFGETSGPTVRQRYFLGMLKFSRDLGPRGRIHPYGGAGVGYGTFKYEYGGFQDNSTVYAINAGADVDIVPNLAVKVDWQYQFWDLGVETNGFTPSGLSAGFTYRIRPLSFRRGR
jgi:opacity protein-like surface antigen